MWIAALLAITAAPARADEKPVLHATVLSAAQQDVRLDGELNEAVWATADSVPNLITFEPVEGGVPAGRTVIRVLVHQTEIIIGAQCDDDDPAGIVSFSKARDSDLSDEDYLEFVLDTFGDQRSGYVFAVNPGGARFDGLVAAQGMDVNSDWDTIWEAATVMNGRGWSAEIRLPLQSLSFKKGLTSWGFNVERHVERLQETSRWSGAKRDFEIYQTSQAGILADLPNFDLGIGLMVEPSFINDAARPQPGASWHRNREISLDMSQMIGSNLTSRLTVNTDFGETEADLRQTNLSRFSVLLPEQRSFFLDGSDIFEFGSGLDVDDATLLPFFSRRIGIHVPSGEDEDDGKQVPLIAGGKLQGRVGSTNLGALVVSTDKVPELAVPKATMGAVRVYQNVLSESSIGLIGTFGDPLNRKDSWLGGTDFNYRTSEFLEDKNLQGGLWGLMTDRKGIKGTKRAFGGTLAYPNDPLAMHLTYLNIGTGFDPSLGFVQRTGRIAETGVDFTHRPESFLGIREQSYGLSGFAAVDQKRKWDSYVVTVSPINWLFESGERFEVSIEPTGDHPREAFDVFDSPDKTITIPPGEYGWTRYNLTLASAEKRRISGDLLLSSGGFYKGTLRTLEANALLQPASALTLRLSGERNVGKLPQGDFTQFLYSVRLELKISPQFQITNVAQYDNESQSLGSATRLRWTFLRQGDVFVAFDTNYKQITKSTHTRWDFQSDHFMIKFRYALRV